MRLIIAVLSILVAHSAYAQEDGTRVGMFFLPNDRPNAIALVDEVTIAAAADFFRALRVRPNAKELILLSGGGSVYGALSIALQVHERGMSTVVPSNGWCYSACAYIYFAGATRKLFGELGVHQISADGELPMSATQSTIADILDALETFGVDPGVLSVMFRTAADDIHIFSTAEIAEFGIETLTSGAVSGGGDVDSPEAERPAVAVVLPSLAAPLSAPSISPIGDDTILLVVPENLSIVPQNSRTSGLGRADRVLTALEPVALANFLSRNGFTREMVQAVEQTLSGEDFLDMGVLPVGAHLRILFGPSRSSGTLIPYRLSIYLPKGVAMEHVATVALTDQGQYVRGLEPTFGADGISRKNDRGKQDRAGPAS